jgi:hypothetical protein
MMDFAENLGKRVNGSKTIAFFYTPFSDAVISTFMSPQSLTGRLLTHRIQYGFTPGFAGLGVSYLAEKTYYWLSRGQLLNWLEFRREQDWNHHTVQFCTRAIVHVAIGTGLGFVIGATAATGFAVGAAAFIGPLLARLIYKVSEVALSYFYPGKDLYIHENSLRSLIDFSILFYIPFWDSVAGIFVSPHSFVGHFLTHKIQDSLTVGVAGMGVSYLAEETHDWIMDYLPFSHRSKNYEEQVWKYHAIDFSTRSFIHIAIGSGLGLGISLALPATGATAAGGFALGAATFAAKFVGTQLFKLARKVAKLLDSWVQGRVDAINQKTDKNNKKTIATLFCGIAKEFVNTYKINPPSFSHKECIPFAKDYIDKAFLKNEPLNLINPSEKIRIQAIQNDEFTELTEKDIEFINKKFTYAQTLLNHIDNISLIMKFGLKCYPAHEDSFNKEILKSSSRPLLWLMFQIIKNIASSDQKKLSEALQPKSHPLTIDEEPSTDNFTFVDMALSNFYEEIFEARKEQLSAYICSEEEVEFINHVLKFIAREELFPPEN